LPSNIYVLHLSASAAQTCRHCCCRLHLHVLTLCCALCLQENQRLRSAEAGGEELLSHKALLMPCVHALTLRCTLCSAVDVCALCLQENQRLRSAEAGGEELLSGALQQLLGQKSELQQEVARLRSQNQALQVRAVVRIRMHMCSTCVAARSTGVRGLLATG
jgi:hypothetical protein